MGDQLIVQKFGGSSLARPEQIKAVAKKIKELHLSGQKMLIVTSAMGKTTDQLSELARQLSSHPNRRELDMLLTAGERISMALMSIALQDIGCPAISFTGSQAGIMTDGSFTNAQITEIKPFRVAEALKENRVVILAGFQGVDPITKEITTLGRGGSDTTAVAMAAHFQAERCEILKDVDGVMNADPKIVPNAQLIKNISAKHLYEFCFWGAKVLNYRSVEYAQKFKVPLAIGRSDNFQIGTHIDYSEHSSKAKQLIGVNSHEFVFEIRIACTDRDEGLQKLKNILKESDLPWPQILQEKQDSGWLQLLLTTDAHDYQQMIQTIENSSQIKILQKNVSTVTASFEGAPPDIKVVPRSERAATIQNYFN